MSNRIKLIAVVAVVLALLIGVVASTTHKAYAHSASTKISKVASANPANCMDYRPWNVTVATCWQVVDTVDTGYGYSFGCITLDGDPLGYYTTTTRYIGWSYQDTSGNQYVDHDSQGNAFPYSLTTIINSYDCSLPTN